MLSSLVFLMSWLCPFHLWSVVFEDILQRRNSISKDGLIKTIWQFLDCYFPTYRIWVICSRKSGTWFGCDIIFHSLKEKDFWSVFTNFCHSHSDNSREKGKRFSNYYFVVVLIDSWERFNLTVAGAIALPIWIFRDRQKVVFQNSLSKLGDLIHGRPLKKQKPPLFTSQSFHYKFVCLNNRRRSIDYDGILQVTKVCNCTNCWA